jgi:glutamate carboxypeptidase
MSGIPPLATLEALRARVSSRLDDYMADLRHLVNIESGTYTKAGVDSIVSWMATRLAALGAEVERHPGADLGDTMVATFHGAMAGPTVLLIGHADTVFEPGHLARRPYEIVGEHVVGPGVADMKSGLLTGLYAIDAIQAAGGQDPVWLPLGRLIYVVNPDEEIGSPSSAAIITEVARGADVVLVLEGARHNGAIVSARKGMMHVRATVTGRSAHAGLEPHKGRSAVLEAAHKTLALHDLNGRWSSVSVNVGSLSGGTRPNIVPDQAVMQIDMRAGHRADQDEATAAILEILRASTVPDTETTVQITANHGPMEKTPASTRLVDQAVAIASALGFVLTDTATGGASDANLTAGMGVPTLDGLGPVGSDPHTSTERLVADSIVPRTALLAGLLLAQATVARDV